jgi:hypothetical protein
MIHYMAEQIEILLHMGKVSAAKLTKYRVL